MTTTSSAQRADIFEGSNFRPKPVQRQKSTKDNPFEQTGADNVSYLNTQSSGEGGNGGSEPPNDQGSAGAQEGGNQGNEKPNRKDKTEEVPPKTKSQKIAHNAALACGLTALSIMGASIFACFVKTISGR